MSFNVLKINRDNLRNNINIIRNISKGAKVCIPVKANAYGHGLELVVEHTKDLVDYFAVACISEAQRVFNIVPDKDILVFGAIERSNILDVFHNDFIISIQSLDDILYLEECSKVYLKKVRAHININTGMNRMGVNFNAYEDIITAAYNSKYVDLLGVYSHFACADNKDHPANKKQITRFKEIMSFAKSLDENIICHLANSYGLIGQKNIEFDMVRTGILTYGHLPYFYVDREVREIKPIARLVSKIVKIFTLDEDDGVGYSLVYRGAQNEQIATLPIGYGDGFFRALGDRGMVCIDGNLYPIVGRISMDALAISLGQNSNGIKIGDEVELISDAPKKRNSAFFIAQLVNTIEYDVTSVLNERIDRVVV